jgi:hypothetical protein
MPLKEALEKTRDLLNGINVPVGLFEQIGAPVMAAIRNLQACIDSIPDRPPEAQEAPEGGGDE